MIKFDWLKYKIIQYRDYYEKYEYEQLVSIINTISLDDYLQKCGIGYAIISKNQSSDLGYELCYECLFKLFYLDECYSLVDAYLEKGGTSVKIIAPLLHRLINSADYMSVYKYIDIIGAEKIRYICNKNKGLLNRLLKLFINTYDYKRIELFLPEKTSFSKNINFISIYDKMLKLNFNRHNEIIQELIDNKLYNEAIVSIWASYHIGNRSQKFLLLSIDKFPIEHRDRSFFFTFVAVRCFPNNELFVKKVLSICCTYNLVHYINVFLYGYFQSYCYADKYYSSDIDEIIRYYLLSCMLQDITAVSNHYIESCIDMTHVRPLIVKRTSKVNKTNTKIFHFSNNFTNKKVAIEMSGQFRGELSSIMYDFGDSVNADLLIDTWDSGVKYSKKMTKLNRIFGKELVDLLPTDLANDIDKFASFFPQTMSFISKCSNIYSISDNDLNMVCNPCKVNVESEIEFEKYCNQFCHGLKIGDSLNQAKMFYKIHSAHKLSNDDYDVIIRMRPDVHIKIPNLQDMIDYVYHNQNTVITTYISHKVGCGDQFFIASNHAMMRIAKLWEYIRDSNDFRYSHAMNSRYYAEQLLGYHCFLEGLNIKLISPLKMNLDNSLMINCEDFSIPFLSDLSNQANQEGKLFVEKYIEGKKNYVVFS